MKLAEKKLRVTLKSNALFSMLSGFSLLLFSKKIGVIMNIQNTDILKYIGIALLLFVVFLCYSAFKTKLNKPQIRSIIIQDWAWVLASIVLLILQPFQLSFTGNFLIAIVACIVMGFAIFQQLNLKKLAD